MYAPLVDQYSKVADLARRDVVMRNIDSYFHQIKPNKGL